MATKELSTVLGINNKTKQFEFYSMLGTDYHTINTENYPYKNNIGTEQFMDELNEAMKKYALKRPSTKAATLNIVLPDYLIALDNISIPTISKRAMDNSLKIALEGLYKNYKDLKVNTVLATKNKQYATYSIAMMPQKLNAALSAACSLNKLAPGVITYAGNASVAAVSVMRKKYATSSYVFLDIKDKYSRLTYVVKGKAFGSYDLGFGYTILRGNKLAAEDLIIEHNLAEITVLNAREKARAKTLTVMSDDSSDSEGESTAAATPAETEAAPAATAESDPQKLFTRKTARKLPKFMLRPTPDTEEGYVYENFRLFVKWALTFIRGNETLAAFGKPEFVLVNMPSDFNYVYELVNTEKDENGVEFRGYDPASDRYSSITDNMELFGGLFLSAYPSINNL